MKKNLRTRIIIFLALMAFLAVTIYNTRIGSYDAQYAGYYVDCYGYTLLIETRGKPGLHFGGY
jgi:hypothetical protein